MSDDQFDDFEDFWPHYVAEHSDPLNRFIHAVGTTGAIATAVVGLVKRDARLLALAPVIGYGSAWAGHLFVENNKPATFDHPMWSLRGDMRMLKLMLQDEMDEEILRLIGDGQYAPQLLEDFDL